MDNEDGQEKEGSSHNMSKSSEESREKSLDCCALKLRKFVNRRVSPENNFDFDVNLLDSYSCTKGPLHGRTRVLYYNIPKHMVNLDEKYLRCCLELIYRSASYAAQGNILINFGSMSMGISLYDSKATDIRANTFELSRLVREYPPAGLGDVVVSSVGQRGVDLIMGSRSMMHLLKSPLLYKVTAFARFENSRLNAKGAISDNSMGFPSGLSNNSKHKLEKGNQSLLDLKYKSESTHDMLSSRSSTISPCSFVGSSSSSSTVSLSQGMIQCSWKAGIPSFVFSLDDQRGFFVADLSRTVLDDEKAQDYMYLFTLKKSTDKKIGICDKESHLIAKMKVSTSFAHYPNTSNIIEREFVLFANGESVVEGAQNSHRSIKKKMGLSKKVLEAFRNGRPSMQKRIPKSDGYSSSEEYCLWKPRRYRDKDLDVEGVKNAVQDHLLPNLELAAIVVKDHLPYISQHEVGGWGLRFLKNVGVKHSTETRKASLPSDCISYSGCCSRSIDVLIPEGLHGGHSTSNSGPSSLIERWRSGGSCDCGGWDLGCPLTVLNTRSDKEGDSPNSKMDGDCKQVDLFLKGSEHGVPKFRMTDIHEGSYFIQFQSTLSALQSFAIAVAYIHSQSPALQPHLLLK